MEPSDEPPAAPVTGAAPPRSPSGRGTRIFARDTTEFDRSLAFVDAIFAFSITLLVTNIDMPAGTEWRSVHTLLAGTVGDQLFGFLISFAVIAGFWRLNHRVVSEFTALDPVTVNVNVLIAGLVVFVPFTTQGISDTDTSGLPLPTALYAVNVALVVLVFVLLATLARRRGLADRRAAGAVETAQPLVVAAVFLVSIPIAYLVDAQTAQLSWLSLLLVGPVLRLFERRAARAA